MEMITRKQELRELINTILHDGGFDFKIFPEFPIKTFDMGVKAYDRFTYPAWGGLHWYQPDFSLGTGRGLIITKLIGTRMTAVTARNFDEEYELLELACKATGYLYPIVVTNSSALAGELAQFSDKEYNIVTLSELADVVTTLEENQLFSG